jgi:hypothetical protein
MILLKKAINTSPTSFSYKVEILWEEASRESSPFQIMIDQKRRKNEKYFSYLGTCPKMMQNIHVKLNPELQW